MTKRAFDALLSGAGLVVLSPLLVVIAVLVKVGSPGPVLFAQERIGRRFHPFVVYKFRTMRADASGVGPALTVGNDPRVTRVGRVLRRTKLDELPQLWNVLKGDMSLVGPRPELPRFVQMFRTEYGDILEARPGITDLASLKYRDEAAVLARSADPETEYINRILPDKIRLARETVRRSSTAFDLVVIAKTLLRVGGWSTSR